MISLDNTLKPQSQWFGEFDHSWFEELLTAFKNY